MCRKDALPEATWDESAFTEFTPHLEMVFGVATRFVADPREAEEIVSQALVTAAARRRDPNLHQTPKMALLSALREAYVREGRHTLLAGSRSS